MEDNIKNLLLHSAERMTRILSGTFPAKIVREEIQILRSRLNKFEDKIREKKDTDGI